MLYTVTEYTVWYRKNGRSWYWDTFTDKTDAEAEVKAMQRACSLPDCDGHISNAIFYYQETRR